jgi:AcrR family transcriptional regulator
MDVSHAQSLPRPATSARTRSREETRRRLLASGRELFATRGLHRVTTHDIARGAGVAAGTFYLHFSDKESLFREIVYFTIERMRSDLQEAMDSAPDGEAAVRAHAEAMIAFAEANSDLVRIVFGRDHGAAEVESDVLDYLADAGAEMLSKRIAEGTFRATLDPKVAAQALTGMFARTVVWWIEDPTRVPRETLIETLIGMQLRGTYPRPVA